MKEERRDPIVLISGDPAADAGDEKRLFRMLRRILDEALHFLHEPLQPIHRRDRIGPAGRANAYSRLGAAMVLRIPGRAGVMTPLFIRAEDEDVSRRIEGAFVFLCMHVARYHCIRFG
jgi:hypothetical protein